MRHLEYIIVLSFNEASRPKRAARFVFFLNKTKTCSFLKTSIKYEHRKN